MSKILVELPKDTLYFKNEDDFKLYDKEFNVWVSPDKYPCYGIIAISCMVNNDGPDYIVLAYIYPEKKKTGLIKL